MSNVNEEPEVICPSILAVVLNDGHEGKRWKTPTNEREMMELLLDKEIVDVK